MVKLFNKVNNANQERHLNRKFTTSIDLTVNFLTTNVTSQNTCNMIIFLKYRHKNRNIKGYTRFGSLRTEASKGILEA